MLFVDGENLCIRAQESAKEAGKELGTRHMPNTYFWPPFQAYVPQSLHQQAGMDIDTTIRSFYYTAVQGDADKLEDVVDAIRQLGFTAPRVFRKQRGKPSKGVDVQLTIDVLSNAYMENYDVALLVAGDADYVPLIHEVQRLGKRVYLTFIENGLSKNLKNAADSFRPMRIF